MQEKGPSSTVYKTPSLGYMGFGYVSYIAKYFPYYWGGTHMHGNANNFGYFDGHVQAACYEDIYDDQSAWDARQELGPIW